jgi:hypothetical protein
MTYLDKPISQGSTLPVLLIWNVKGRRAPQASKTNAVKDILQHLCGIYAARKLRI